MLSYNSTPAGDGHDSACADPGCDAHRTARRAHAAHAVVLGLHTICCGLPVAATLVASGAVGLVGIAALETFAHDLHEQLHHYEGWILGASALLVAIGGLAELAARRQGLRRFPVFFAVSVACLAMNTALVVSHRADQSLVQMALAPAASARPLAVSAPPVAPVSAAPAAADHGHDHDHSHDHAH